MAMALCRLMQLGQKLLSERNQDLQFGGTGCRATVSSAQTKAELAPAAFRITLFASLLAKNFCKY